MEGENRINLITCIKWVCRGVAKSTPDKVQLTKEELTQVINETRAKLSTADESTSGHVETTEGDEFNMDQYDAEEELDSVRLGIDGLTELNTDATDNLSDSDDSEKEDDEIKPDDNLILVGKADEDASIFEIYVYNEKEGSLYVHHDLILPAFPLCLEWLDYEPGQPKGNYCAMGTMSPIIDIWDLDIMNCLEPAFQLGKVKRGTTSVGHVDAVLGLAWNNIYHHVLGSGSVDTSIILWDLDTQTPSTTIKAFQDKVQCLEWHKLEAQTLLAGGCDKTVRIFDCRSPETFQSWDLNGEAEHLCWNTLQPFTFLVGSSEGTVQCFDCRKGEVWNESVHDGEVTGLSISKQCPGLMITSAVNGEVKIWDFGDNGPSLIACKDLKIGNVHSLDLCPDSPFMIAAGGNKKSHNFVVTDLLEDESVRNKFGERKLIELKPESVENVQEGTV